MNNLISECKNMSWEEYLPSFPDQFFDWAIVDIPYGINVTKMAFTKDFRTSTKQSNGNKLSARKHKIHIPQENWDDNVPGQDYFDLLRSKSKNQIVFGIEYVDWDGVGQGRIKWNKGVPEGLDFKGYELMYCSVISETVTIDLLWSGMRQAKSLAEPMVQQGNKQLNEKRIHVCHKPVLLYKRLLLDYVTRGQKVIDTHLGGGSNRIACYDFGVDFYSCEISPFIFSLQEKRFRNHVAQIGISFPDSLVA